jgi:hypothetical protein
MNFFHICFLFLQCSNTTKINNKIYCWFTLFQAYMSHFQNGINACNRNFCKHQLRLHILFYLTGGSFLLHLPVYCYSRWTANSNVASFWSFFDFHMRNSIPLSNPRSLVVFTRQPSAFSFILISLSVVIEFLQNRIIYSSLNPK